MFKWNGQNSTPLKGCIVLWPHCHHHTTKRVCKNKEPINCVYSATKIFSINIYFSRIYSLNERFERQLFFNSIYFIFLLFFVLLAARANFLRYERGGCVWIKSKLKTLCQQRYTTGRTEKYTVVDIMVRCARFVRYAQNALSTLRRENFFKLSAAVYKTKTTKVFFSFLFCKHTYISAVCRKSQ